MTNVSERIDPEELKKIWVEFKTTNDQSLRNRIITNYLHLVKYVVGRLIINLPSHVKVDDMYSTGILGLIKAIERYDLTKKNKFETYAILLIKGAIIDEMRALDWVPRSVHQKAHQIADAQAAVEQKLGREATDGEVAKQMGVSLREYEDLLDRVQPAVMIPLNLNVDHDAERGPVCERIPDKSAKTSFEMADYNEFRHILEAAVMELPDQERTVLVLYYYESMMLKEIGQALGVSESRISQVHTKAISRLKGRLQQFGKEYANLL